MAYKTHVLFIVLILFSAYAKAQDSLKTQVSFDLATEAAVGTGDYTAYQIVSNRYHVLGTRSNTAYLRGAVNVEHRLSKDFLLSGVVDGVASVHADHKAYLQQCYVNLSYQPFFVEAGMREIKPAMREEQLSSGSFVLGSNAKPIPQVRVGTDGFWTVPFTKKWLEISFDCGYGKFMDDDYRKDLFDLSPPMNMSCATGAYYHQKYLYLRTNSSMRFYFVAGMEHAVQVCGTGYKYADGVVKAKEKPVSLRSLFDVFLPLGDSHYYEHDAMEDWIYGNHIGMMTIQLGWNINKHELLEAYIDNPFEDGSGIRKGNGWDGLWGLQYSNKSEGIQTVRGVVAEYFQTTNQSGPLHWDSRDYPEPVRSQVTDYVTGKDNYYNHSFYNNYGYYGMALGNPLLTSPIYNKDGYTAFRDNRIKAWHLGVKGEISDRLSYLVKGSYREGWGTYDVPLPDKHYSFDAMVQGLYKMGPWQFSAAYALDKGNIYGNCSTFDIKIGYHGKIL